MTLGFVYERVTYQGYLPLCTKCNDMVVSNSLGLLDHSKVKLPKIHFNYLTCFDKRTRSYSNVKKSHNHKNHAILPTAINDYKLREQ